MPDEDYPAAGSADTPRTYVKSEAADISKRRKNKYKKRSTKNEDGDKENLLQRLPRLQTALTPRFGRFRNSFRKLNCFKNQEEEEVPMMEIQRHKSIDIGVGLARRVSLFLFTRRTVCVHPYHPYTPEQTTRKIYFYNEDK